MPVKKATRSKASAASKKSTAAATASSKTSAPSKRQFGAGAMLVTAMCVTGAVIVIAAREMSPSPRAEVSTEVHPDAGVPAPKPKPMVSTAIVDVSPVSTNSEMDASKTSAAKTAPARNAMETESQRMFSSSRAKRAGERETSACSVLDPRVAGATAT